MSHNYLLNTSFHQSLLAFDFDTARQVQAKNCNHCGGLLHQAHYPRLGFGVPSELASLYQSRYSFCCAQCRKRTTPPSLRFFGRRRYIAPLFLLLCSVRFSPCEKRCERWAKRRGIQLSLSTWKRWVSWWQRDFPQTPFWSIAKACFLPPLNVNPSLRALLKSLAGKVLPQQLTQLLQFLSPLSIDAR